VTRSPRSRIAWIAAALVVAMQLVPYGHDRSNPPVTAEPPWDAPATRALAVRACFDCHSHETRWPVYARVAPVSWLIASDVAEGREALNFSAWKAPHDPEEVPKAVREGDMPPWLYTLMHGTARLTGAERQALAQGLAATITAQSGSSSK
jgi:mono/diheme cytochrome c family protein